MLKIKLIIFRLIQIFTLSKVFWDKNKNVYLTFDDGPDAAQTPLILDLLKKYNAKATFFLQGEYAEKYPEILDRMSAEGHTLANHTYSHIRFQDNINDFMEDVEKCENVIKDYYKGTRYFRVPYGTVSLKLFLALLKKGYKVAFWNEDTKDYKLETSEEVKDYLNIEALKNGDVVLLHDYPAVTPEILESILKAHPDKSFKAL